MKSLNYLVVAAALLIPATHCSPTRQFDWFFPDWNAMIQDILREKCSSQLARYKSGHSESGGSLSSLVTPVLDCVLNDFPEFRKAELAASAVILGFTPTLLQSLGSTTAETALVGLKRPVLAFLLAAGSPAVSNGKAEEFMETVDKFVGKDDHSSFTLPGVSWSSLPPFARPILGIAEYVAVAGAVANVILLAYRLGVFAIVGFARETIFMLPLWTFLAVVTHLGGSIALRLRVKIKEPEPEKLGMETAKKRGAFLSEFTPTAYQRIKQLSWRKDNIVFYSLTWLISIGSVAHIVFGTLIMSSLLFFSVLDSVTIIGRYAASAMVCRAIVRLELSGLRWATMQQASVLAVEEGI